MAEYHPFLVHFPIALILVASVLRIINEINPGLQRGIPFLLLCIGALFSLFAALAGDAAYSEAVNIPGIQTDLDRHASLGSLMVWLSLSGSFVLLLLLLKQIKMSILEILIFVGLSIGVLLTGFSGGKLHREFGAGFAPGKHPLAMPDSVSHDKN